MFFISLLSFSAGYFLNEEKSLDRLCKNLGYAHEGWLVFHHEGGMIIYIFFFALSVIKSWGWVLLLKNSLPFWYIPACFYILGNATAIFMLNKAGVIFSFWCSLVGTLLTFNKVLLQISLTAAVVGYLVTRRKDVALKAGKIVFGGATILFSMCNTWGIEMYVIGVIILAWLFLKRSHLLQID